MSQFPAALSPKDEDIKKLLAVGAHIGTANIEHNMNRYVWRRRPDGIHIINLAKLWEKLVLAARIIAGIENPSDVCVVAAPILGQRAALKFANFTGAHAITGRYTPGTFTNQIQEKFIEPRLLFVTDPRIDHQAVTESAYVNLPTIALCNVDSSVKNIDIVIPCNNRSTESVGLIYWFLAREILYLRGTIPRNQPWDVMVDLFFYRPPEEITAEKKAQEEAQAQQQAQISTHPPPFENPNVFRPPISEGTDWSAIPVGGTDVWDAPSGETWGGPSTSTRNTNTWDSSSPSAAPSTGWDSNL